VHYLAQPGPTLLDRFAWLIAGLRHYVGEIYMRDRSALPFTVLVHGRLRRLATRFAALVARVEAGTVRPVRVRVAPRAARVALPAALPRGFGWLAKLMPEGHPYAEYLERQLLPDAEMASLLAAAPQAGRTLRAVLWMMGRPVPEVLRVARMGPPRPRKPRPSRAIVIPDFKYIEQPYKSHYPRSVWPSHADLKRVARQMVRDARLKTLGK